MIRPIGVALCMCVLVVTVLRSDEQEDGAPKSPLRNSLGKTWRVEYMMKQRPPNRGRRLISLDHDGEITGTIRKEKTLSAEERDRLLDLAVLALEAFAFEPRMGNIVDSPEMSLSLSSGSRRMKIHILEYGGETNEQLKKLLEQFETFADGTDPGPPPERKNAERLSGISGRWDVKVTINDLSQRLAGNALSRRDLALKIVRDFTFAPGEGADKGPDTVSVSITSPSLEGFRRIEISEKWLVSDAIRASFISELVAFDGE
jgi:hypothetical protein